MVQGGNNVKHRQDIGKVKKESWGDGLGMSGKGGSERPRGVVAVFKIDIKRGRRGHRRKSVFYMIGERRKGERKGEGGGVIFELSKEG